MSSKEQELPTSKNDDDKPDSLSQPMETPESKPDDTFKNSGGTIKDISTDSNPLNDAAIKDCEDNSKQTTDNPSEPVDLNKSSEFDDEDDFNSDELQLRWEDDDEPVTEEKSNDKELVTKVENPAISLVTAVKELENALVETDSNDVNVASPAKDIIDTIDNKEGECNSSKKILDDIDKLIGNDEVNKTENNANDQTVSKSVLTKLEKSNEDPAICIDSTLESDKTTNYEANSNYKMNQDSLGSSKDLITKDAVESKTDANNLDESTESIEVINESSLFSSTVNESSLETSTRVEHGLKKPDMMLEIPTQEIIDCMDDFDSDNDTSDDKVTSVDVSQQISSLEEDIDKKITDTGKENKEIENISKPSGKYLDFDENVTKQVDNQKQDIDRTKNDEQSLKQISNLTVKDVGDDVAKGPDSQMEIEIIDPQIADNTSDMTIDQALEKNVDMEMCDVSVESKTVVTSVIDEATHPMKVSHIDDIKSKEISNNDSNLEVDEIITLEKGLKSASVSDDLQDLEKEHKIVDENVVLIEAEGNKKLYNKPQLSIEEVTRQTNDKDTFEQVEKNTLKINDTLATTNVLETIAEVKDTETKAVLENLDTNAEISMKLSLKEDTEQKSSTDIKSTEIIQEADVKQELVDDKQEMEDVIQELVDVKQEMEDVKQELEDTTEELEDTTEESEDVKPIITPSLNTVSVKVEEICVEEEMILPQLEQITTYELLYGSVKLEPNTQDQTLQDATTTASENITVKSTLDEATSSIDSSNIEPTPPTLDKMSMKQESKDPVSDQPSTSTKPTSNEDPLLDQSKDSVLDKPSTSTESTSKDASIIESTPNLDPVTESKDPVDPESKDEPSTSKPDKPMDQIPDTTDEVPEMEDTLGLLAESSRVMDADAEEGSSEGGEADEDEEVDDDDFDPDDESSNQMTAEHSEESNAQPDKEDKTPEEQKEFNFAIADVTTAKDMEIITTEEAAADDVATATETMPATAEAGPETDTADEEITLQEKTEETDTVEESNNFGILKKLLVNKAHSSSEMLSKAAKMSAEGVVDIESSSEDDEINKKKVTTSIDKEEADKKRKVKSASEETPKTPEYNDALPVIEKTISESAKVPTIDSEIFNLDSDEDDVPTIASGKVVIEDKRESNKCINPSCRSGANTTYVLADAAARAYFLVYKNKKRKVCLTCAEAVAERTEGLVKGIKEFIPLLELDYRKVTSETVEISDSDSEDGDTETIQQDILGESGAKFLEENLADVINETWLKYKLDERLVEAQSELDKELEKMEADSKEIDTMLNECQAATDLLRNQLYATFEPERRELTPICIFDTPMEKYSMCETGPPKEASGAETRLKRKSTTTLEQPAKRPAIPLGYSPLETEDTKGSAEHSNVDDDKDVSVVKLSAESAPSDLPPPGEITRQTLRAGMSVFAMRNSFCTWVPGKIIEVQPKNAANPFTMCRVRFEIRQKIATRILAARCLAYYQPADVRLTIGTRVIALSQENAKAEEASKKNTYYSGIVAEIPNPVNSYRYLIFFDHGYAQYVHHKDTRVVCESANLVWEEVHPNSREFVKQYLLAYPERPMVRLHAGQSLKTEWNGKWWVTKVLQVDASLVEVSFEDNRTEWIYRGSTRLAPLFLELQAAERQRARPLPRSNQRRLNMPYVEYTRSEEQNKAEAVAAAEKARQEQQNEEMRRQRAVARKSTTLPAPPPAQAPPPNLDSVTSRVVYYTPKNAVKPLKMTPHTCSPKCKRSDVLALKDLRTYNPLAKPLLSGWERQIVRFKGHKEVMYRAPCGRRLRNLRELHRYLRAVQSDMGVDLFDFGANTHCLAEFVLNKCLVGKKDLSHGKENVPVPCVNYYDESLPEFCSYNTERTPTAGVPLNLDPEFLCGCDCTDDCEDKSKCACWKMTLEGARTIGLAGTRVGYEYKRLPEPLPSGIYECNSRCKCKQTCLNRVAQHPLQLKLQVFKTMNRGWGIRALNDVPKGSFLCVYAGNLLTDATANLDGLNEGDEYLAELDYIEVVEQMKEGFEEDIPDADKKLDRESSKSSSEEDEPSSEEDENSNDKEDGDFQPGFIGLGLTEFNKRLRKRDRTRKKDAEKLKDKEIDKGMEDDGCITISDDEEAKEPAQFTAQTGIGANEFVPKYKSVRTLFGKDEACYIMDAKVQGNIGRYLNHSCTPNVFVQNVFVDTHDPRFPWVAFFALSHIRAGTELTWNYNYDVGSVPGKVLYCYCGAPNCRGRLL